MHIRTIILIILLACILAAGCVSSDAPGVEDPPKWVDEEVQPMPTPAPTPTRTPVSPVEMVAPEPTPTPTPRNVTTTLCDYPPCGRGGGGGGSGGTAEPPICEMPTVLLVLAGIGVVAICVRRQR